ncbi:MobC family plasmid mobilization relaxosome protein [Streptomyces caniferus]|uniref:plasmid mobilization protein n=1 Tax=Streptomyces caniferus TaxID=285557 RepID=UPI002E2A0365|nr:plasmid mobilization relaxosome protein MobC [Streptomyces caniferus]
MAEGGHEQKGKPKQGRRRPRQDKQRGRRQTFRASETEEAEIDAAAAAKGISKARFMAQAVRSTIHGRTGLDQDEALDRLEAARVQLSRVGNNVNQIARILNSGGDVIHIARAADEVREAAAAVKAAAQKLVG